MKKNKNNIQPEISVDSMSVGQCENALTELMAELEALAMEEPTLSSTEEIFATEKTAEPLIEGDYKGLDSKKADGDAVFAFTLTALPEDAEDDNMSSSTKVESVDDIYGETLFETAARLVVGEGVTSVSYLQRRLGLGYDKASEIIDRLEELSVVSPVDGNRPRRVLVSSEKLEKILDGLKRA